MPKISAASAIKPCPEIVLCAKLLVVVSVIVAPPWPASNPLRRNASTEAHAGRSVAQSSEQGCSKQYAKQRYRNTVKSVAWRSGHNRLIAEDA
ncbi:MAG TPA: hypothetical protein VL921_16260 [Candidatus Udaeobacter sp.]|nr:hypothetical protein [Candidatus Udaeobacter sp.]